MRLHHEIAALPADERVAVRRRARAELEAELSCRADAVVDDETLAEPLEDFRRDQPRHRVERVTRRKGNDDAYRLGRVLLRVQRRRK
jgi:hypothetical protein